MMVRFLVIALFIIHGLISAGQSFGKLAGKGSTVENPAWLAWWPARLGDSWLLNRLGIESRFVLAIIGVLWLAAAVGFIAAGLGMAGLWVPAELWRPLAGGAAVVSLVVLALTFHPYFAAAVVLNAAILLAARAPGALRL